MAHTVGWATQLRMRYTPPHSTCDYMYTETSTTTLTIVRSPHTQALEVEGVDETTMGRYHKTKTWLTASHCQCDHTIYVAENGAMKAPRFAETTDGTNSRLGDTTSNA